jgi:Acetyltransferase (GNAT) domain
VQKEVWIDAAGSYFCNIVVEEPAVQGRGVGRNLMEVVTDRADREGRKCSQESSRKQPNVTIYERMEFKAAGGMNREDGRDTCDLYCMIRDPRSNAGQLAAFTSSCSLNHPVVMRDAQTLCRRISAILDRPWRERAECVAECVLPEHHVEMSRLSWTSGSGSCLKSMLHSAKFNQHRHY